MNQLKNGLKKCLSLLRNNQNEGHSNGKKMQPLSCCLFLRISFLSDLP